MTRRSEKRRSRGGQRCGTSANPKLEKVCPVCERPFHWRARWKNNWDKIVYCSRRCSSQRWKLQSDSST
ncbi:MAG: DUF2256 domain-containing protein [Halieaceae bacterium]|nr:DUF2256 domain-containing protein [Halieaceae bacterium]